MDGGGSGTEGMCQHLAQWVGREWVGRTLQAKDTNDGLGGGGRWAMLSALTP